MIKNKKLYLPLGLFSLFFAILIGRYVDPTPLFSFLEGMLYGLTLVFNTAAVFYLGKNRKTSSGST